MSEQTFTFRTQGLPPDNSEGQFIGFSKDGRAFVLHWTNEFGFWGAAGFEILENNEPRPLVVACRDEMSDFIVSHARLG